MSDPHELTPKEEVEKMLDEWGNGSDHIVNLALQIARYAERRALERAGDEWRGTSDQRVEGADGRA